MLPSHLLALRQALAAHIGQTLTPSVCAEIEAQVLRRFVPAAGASVLDGLPQDLQDKLRASFDRAVPCPIPWDEAVVRVALGQWRLVRRDSAVALLEHGQFMGTPLTTIVAVAGELGDCPSLDVAIEQHARSHGSTTVAYLGRRGWTRAFPSYKERAVACVKELQ